MDENAEKALVVAYFLSREEKFAYDYLGYGSRVATHAAVGMKLGQKPNTIKNMRDEFDSVTGSHRKGWHKRKLRPSRLRVVEQYSGVSRDALMHFVGRLLERELPNVEIALSADFLAGNTRDDAVPLDNAVEAMTRAETGRAAEEAFISYHRATGRPVSGNLVDCRDKIVGYDFRIDAENQSVYVEVKGLAAASGSVSMTANEWLTARAYGARYFLALVTNAHAAPEVRLCADPGQKLTPTLRLSKVVQEQWTFSSSSVLNAAS